MNSLAKKLLCISTILTLGTNLLIGCGGRGSMNTPGVESEGQRQSGAADSTATKESDGDNSERPLLYGSNHADKQAARTNEQDPNEVPETVNSPYPFEPD